jgi:hypothetical protein
VLLGKAGAQRAPIFHLEVTEPVMRKNSAPLCESLPSFFVFVRVLCAETFPYAAMSSFDKSS